MKFLCEQCKAKYQIADDKAAGKTVRMKCRKCGHLIEVRAAVTETSVSSSLPRDRSSAPPAPARPPPRPLPPRAKPFLPVDPGAGHGRPSPSGVGSPERTPGALEGAFKSAVQHDNMSAVPVRRGSRIEDEVSAPFDMADLSPSDEWYVAINGVPVGPIRVAEVRRKAALGAVSEDSLVWQEGLDEWRPLRLFPELAASVREAMSRLSRPPPSETRSSLPPPPPGRAPARPSGNAPRTTAPRSLPPPSSIGPRSNVVPFTSRLATAEKFDPAFAHATQPQERTSPVPGPAFAQPKPLIPSVAPDPFASPPAALAAGPVTTALVPLPPVLTIPPGLRKSPPWIPLTMLASAVAFSVTAAYMFFSRPAEAPAPPVAWPGPGSPVAAAPSAAAAPTAPAALPDVPEPAATMAPSTGKASAAPRGAAAAAPAASSTGRSLDLHSLTQNSPNVTPGEAPGSDTPKAGSGQSLTEGQVQQVLALHHAALARVCWERNPTNKPAVNVSVMLTVAPDGSAQNVSATGDEASVAKCIENDVRSWRFPATGSSQKINIPFKFVRQ